MRRASARRVTADDLLERPFDGRGTPPECGELLGETVLLDPGSGRSAALHVIPEPAEEIVQAFMVEQTVWWALRDPLVDPTALLAHSGLAGTLPSPLAITPPAAAWAPRHLDWTVEVFPSPGGAADWTLGEIDMRPDESAIPAATPGTGITISGRSLLTGGIAQAAAAAGRAAIDVGALAGSAGVVPGDNNIFVPAFARATLGRLTAAADGGGASPATQTIAEALVAALRNMDVLAGTLEGVHATLRGEPPGQVVGTDDPPPPEPDPGATGVLAGTLRPARMRLVDAFGQVVDLLGSGAGRPADAASAAKARTLTVPDRPDLVAAPPRFTAPGRVLLRFVDADPSAPAVALEETGEDVRPVCGYLLPDHLDGTLEFFDADGAAVGQVEPSPDGDGRAVWADAPGAPSLAGRPPSGVLADPHLGALADALVRWGVADADREDEGALSALLRLVDSTLWTVDPFAHAGEEHMSLLVGHPIVVLRAALRLDLDDPLQPQDSLTTPVAVRLGALAAWQDGLLGFIVDDDPGTVHAASPAALRTGARGRAQPRLPRAGRRGGGVPQRLRRRPAARHDAALADHASVRVPRPDRLACGRGMPSASRCSSCRRGSSTRRAESFPARRWACDDSGSPTRWRASRRASGSGRCWSIRCGSACRWRPSWAAAGPGTTAAT